MESSSGVNAAASPFRPITDFVADHARGRPDAPAVRQGNRSLSWGELGAAMDRVAASLQRDTAPAPGEPAASIAICGANSIDYLVLFLGGLRAGAAVAPLPTGLLPEQLAAMVDDSGAPLLFAGADVPDLPCSARRIGMDDGAALARWLAPAGSAPATVPVRPEAPFNIIYSSGTTGVPKGIVQPHAMRWAQLGRADTYGWRADSVTLVSTALHSNTTLGTLFPALSKGGTVVLTEGRFDAAGWLRLAQQVRATHAMLVPVQYQRLLAVPDFGRHDLSTFHMKFCTSAPFAAALKADVLARWPGGLVEYYGMTEGGGSCVLEAHVRPDKLHTVGQPAPGHDVRLIDEQGREVPGGAAGEVVGRSAAMMLGYRNRPEATRAAEWFDAEGRRYLRTGDIGRFDADGFLVLVDRRKDIVISGGFNIYPSDLEAVLRRHPGVADVAVVGVPSEEWGESPAAFVVAAAGAPEAAALRAWANERLAGKQRLVDLCYVAELPRSDIGKVLKRELRDRYLAGPGGAALPSQRHAG